MFVISVIIIHEKKRRYIHFLNEINNISNNFYNNAPINPTNNNYNSPSENNNNIALYNKIEPNDENEYDDLSACPPVNDN